jgi:hypothetical protein
MRLSYRVRAADGEWMSVTVQAIYIQGPARLD